MSLRQSDLRAMDPTRRYVRVCDKRADGFVEFEFSIGDPELCVELMLPEEAFGEFCVANEAVILEPARAEKTDWVSRMNESSMQKIEDAS